MGSFSCTASTPFFLTCGYSYMVVVLLYFFVVWISYVPLSVSLQSVHLLYIRKFAPGHFDFLNYMIIPDIFAWQAKKSFSQRLKGIKRTKLAHFIQNNLFNLSTNLSTKIDSWKDQAPLWADAESTPSYSSGLHILVFQDGSERGAFNICHMIFCLRDSKMSKIHKECAYNCGHQVFLDP